MEAAAPREVGEIVEDLLQPLVKKLQAALGDDLLSVILYGSAATSDYQAKVSDLNVLCVLRAIGPDQLDRAFEPVDWWMKKKQPAPVFLSKEELDNAHDAFAIEFVDIRNAYRVLHGEDLAAGIEVDPARHRHQVEHELRSRLVRLRERYLALRKDRSQIVQLLYDSTSTFATLFRHALLLAGAPPAMKKRDVFQAAAQKFGLALEPFETLLACREGERRLRDPEIRPVFENYLAQITRLAELVDQMESAPAGPTS